MTFGVETKANFNIYSTPGWA